ncbi:MAG: 7TM-DISM domain-containing protein [Pseudohongiellaceae bacterium]
MPSRILTPRLTCLLVGLLFGLSFALSQTVLAAELNITENQLPVNLGQYLDHYEDAGGDLTITEVIDGDLPWQRSTQAIPTLGFSSSAHWFYVELTNTRTFASEVVLTLQSATLDQVEFYIVRDSRVVAQTRVGDTISFSELDQPYRIPLVPFALAEDGNPTRVYLRAQSRSGIEMPLSLTTMRLLAMQQQSELTFFGAFFAFFFISFCACAILYYNLNDRKFLGYTLFFGSAIPFFLAQTGMGRVWLWGEFAQANNRIAYLSATLLIVSLCQLGTALSLDWRFRDSVNLVLRFICWLMLPTALYFLVIPIDQIGSEIVLTLMAAGFLVAVTVSVMTGVTAFQGSRAALYLFLSYLLVIIAYSSFLVYKLVFLERTSNNPIVAEVLVVVAGFMLLMSLYEVVRSKNDELRQVRLETRAKADFLRNVSREFLTPVHLILANSKRLMAAQSNKLDAPTRQHMDTVIKQSDHLHNLINDLLEMAELESESFEPRFELVDMPHFLAEVKDMMLPSAMEKGLELCTSYASAKLLVQTDRPRLQHALINILTNAIKYTDKGSITIAYKAVYFRRRLGIEIIISDTGRGMSQDFQKRMFEEFAREQQESEKDPQGTGLGMVIVRRVMEKLGGEISFSSSLGEGTQFFIRLPLRVVTD